PNVESPTHDEDFAVAPNAELLVTVRHSITRYRITLTAWRATVPEKVSGEWRTLVQLEKLAFTAAHKKILARLKSTAAE
ncbi:MAG: hypothetical protein RL380_941, partial [Verrucomicrobiota bacterium]